MNTLPARPLRRAAVIGVVALVAAAADGAAIWLGVTPPVGCFLLPLVSLFMVIGGFVLALVGALVWVFTRFASRTALIVTVVALAVAVAPELASHMLMTLGPSCGD